MGTFFLVHPVETQKLKITRYEEGRVYTREAVFNNNFLELFFSNKDEPGFVCTNFKSSDRAPDRTMLNSLTYFVPCKLMQKLV